MVGLAACGDGGESQAVDDLDALCVEAKAESDVLSELLGDLGDRLQNVTDPAQLTELADDLVLVADRFATSMEELATGLEQLDLPEGAATAQQAAIDSARRAAAQAPPLAERAATALRAADVPALQALQPDLFALQDSVTAMVSARSELGRQVGAEECIDPLA